MPVGRASITASLATLSTMLADYQFNGTLSFHPRTHIQGPHRMSCMEDCRSRRLESERATSRLSAVTAPATPSTFAAAILQPHRVQLTLPMCTRFCQQWP